jgi:division protein CdvB (Snf7/Vps24/ESCRT-III family)
LPYHFLSFLTLLQVRPLQRTVASLQKQLQQQASAHAREVVALSDRVMTVMNELRELRRQAESIQLLRSSIEQLQTELGRIQRGQTSEPSHDPTVSMSTLPDGLSNTTNAG